MGEKKNPRGWHTVCSLMADGHEDHLKYRPAMQSGYEKRLLASGQRLFGREKSVHVEGAENETVRPISAPETEAKNHQVRGARARYLRTDWAGERRGSAPNFPEQNQRLKSMNVGGGAASQ